MSYFAEELERQLAQSNQSIDDLVPKTNISRAQLYLWKRGEQTSITEEQITALATALSSEVQDHAALVRAHLLDERFGPGCELVNIEILSGNILHDRPRSRSKGEHAIAYLAEERVRNRDLNDLLIDLARMLGGSEQTGAKSGQKLTDTERKVVSAVEDEVNRLRGQTEKSE